jgi:ribosomal protein L27
MKNMYECFVGWSLDFNGTTTYLPGVNVAVRYAHSVFTTYEGLMMYATDPNGNRVGTWYV